MVSQGCLREYPHDLHVRREVLRKLCGAEVAEGRSIGASEQSLCSIGRAHGRLAGDLPASSLEAQLHSGQPC